MSFLNGKILKLYTYLCYSVINYSFEASTSISGTCWLFSSAYDFMVSKIDLKPLKLKEESSFTCKKFTKRKINFLSEHVYCDNYKGKQSLLDYIMLPSLKQEEIHLMMRSAL